MVTRALGRDESVSERMFLIDDMEKSEALKERPCVWRMDAARCIRLNRRDGNAR